MLFINRMIGKIILAGKVHGQGKNVPACLQACLRCILIAGTVHAWFMKACLSFCLPDCLPVCVSVCLSVCLSASLYYSACLPVCMSVCLHRALVRHMLGKNHSSWKSLWFRKEDLCPSVCLSILIVLLSLKCTSYQVEIKFRDNTQTTTGLIQTIS